MDNFKLERIVKYFLMGIVIIITAKYIPENKIQTKELYMIGATAAIVFAILDMIAPSITVVSKKKEKI